MLQSLDRNTSHFIGYSLYCLETQTVSNSMDLDQYPLITEHYQCHPCFHSHHIHYLIARHHTSGPYFEFHGQSLSQVYH